MDLSRINRETREKDEVESNFDSPTDVTEFTRVVPKISLQFDKIAQVNFQHLFYLCIILWEDLPLVDGEENTERKSCAGSGPKSI